MARWLITDIPVAGAHLNLDTGGHRRCVALVCLRLGDAVVSRAGSRYGMDWAKPHQAREPFFEMTPVTRFAISALAGLLGDLQPLRRSYDHEKRSSYSR